MQAQVIVQPDALENGPLHAADTPVPQPAPDELLLAVQACGVCRTDLQLAEGDLKARRLPLVPGHQIVGRVEALGSAVDGWEVGERAGAAWLAGACGVCRFCQSARENLCREATFTGWDRDGGYAEFVAVRADFALRVPASFADLEAAPLLVRDPQVALAVGAKARACHRGHADRKPAPHCLTVSRGVAGPHPAGA